MVYAHRIQTFSLNRDQHSLVKPRQCISSTFTHRHSNLIRRLLHNRRRHQRRILISLLHFTAKVGQE